MVFLNVIIGLSWKLEKAQSINPERPGLFYATAPQSDALLLKTYPEAVFFLARKDFEG